MYSRMRIEQMNSNSRLVLQKITKSKFFFTDTWDLFQFSLHFYFLRHERWRIYQASTRTTNGKKRSALTRMSRADGVNSPKGGEHCMRQRIANTVWRWRGWKFKNSLQDLNNYYWFRRCHSPYWQKTILDTKTPFSLCLTWAECPCPSIVTVTAFAPRVWRSLTTAVHFPPPFSTSRTCRPAASTVHASGVFILRSFCRYHE